jgi:hypothetical protein
LSTQLQRLRRIETARRQLVALAEARVVQCEVKCTQLQESRERLLLHANSMFGDLSKMLSRQLSRLDRQLREAEDRHKGALTEALRQKQLLGAWQRLAGRERQQQQQRTSGQALAEVVEAISGAAARDSLP